MVKCSWEECWACVGHVGPNRKYSWLTALGSKYGNPELCEYGNLGKLFHSRLSMNRLIWWLYTIGYTSSLMATRLHPGCIGLDRLWVMEESKNYVGMCVLSCCQCATHSSFSGLCWPQPLTTDPAAAMTCVLVHLKASACLSPFQD